MRNDIVALNGEFGFLTRKFSAICRTMLLRYPGNGKSIPAVCTVATSVPRPPVGPPPAFGALVAGAAFFGGASTGVARVVGAGGALLGAGGTEDGVSRIFGGVGAGFVGAGARVTSPMARGPGGAATILTL